MRPLWKTTIVIWSEYDGTQVELSRLAREAEQGDAFCAKSGSELITDPPQDPDWPGTEFFGPEDEGEDEEEEPGRPQDAIDTVLGALGASFQAQNQIRRTLGIGGDHDR